MAKTKRSLREATGNGKDSDRSSPTATSGSIHDRSSSSHDDVGDANIRRSTRSTKGVPSRRVQLENEESGGLSVLQRVMQTVRSKSCSPEEKDASPANSDITPKIVTEAALRALEIIPGEKAPSPDSGEGSSETKRKFGRTWPKQYRKLARFDGVEHPACSNCGGKVRPQKGGINSRNEYWWRCLNKTCRRWYSRTAQRPDVERSRRQSAAKQRRKRTADPSDDAEPDDAEERVFRKLRRQSRLRRERPADVSSDSWHAYDQDDDYQALIDEATDSPSAVDDESEWHCAEPVTPHPVERLQHVTEKTSRRSMTSFASTWSDKSKPRIVNIMIACPNGQDMLVKLL